MKNFWFISSFILLLTSCSNFFYKRHQALNNAEERTFTCFPDTSDVIKFKSDISYKTSVLSGIMIIKKGENGSVLGGFINEFGVKGFDFEIVKNQTHLGYVFKNLDKWYIRKKLEMDLQFLFSLPEPQQTWLINDSTYYEAAVSRTIHYSFYCDKEKKLLKAYRYNRATRVASLEKYVDNMNKVILKMWYKDGSLSYDFYEINN